MKREYAEADAYSEQSIGQIRESVEANDDAALGSVAGRAGREKAMADIQFSSDPHTASGSFIAVVNDNTELSTNVIEASRPFTVDCSWNIDVITASYLGGTWHVDLYAESINGDFESRIGGTSEAVVPGQIAYKSRITVPGDTLPSDVPVKPQGNDALAYKLVTILRHDNGTVTTSITALVEGPVVLVR